MPTFMCQIKVFILDSQSISMLVSSHLVQKMALLADVSMSKNAIERQTFGIVKTYFKLT
jgi:hypothetical protein